MDAKYDRNGVVIELDAYEAAVLRFCKNSGAL